MECSICRKMGTGTVTFEDGVKCATCVGLKKVLWLPFSCYLGLNALPDHVIFPCGHFVCRKCEAITNCLICEQPVCLVKSSFTLQCYRQMVTDGLIPPSRNGTLLPKTEVSSKKKSAKSRRVWTPSNKRKKPRKSSTSADLELPLTTRVVRSSGRRSCNTLINQRDPGKQKAEEPSVSHIPMEKRSKTKSAEQVKSEKSGIREESAPKDVSPHVHPKKARLLRNCLSASKPRLSVAETAGPDLDSIVKIRSPPPKKRKTVANPRVAITRMNLRVINIDSSDEDDGIFIDSNSIVDCRNTVKVVAQVHENPSFSLQTSLENTQTDESPIKYTQIGLGHLEQDKDKNDLCSGDFVGFENGNNSLQQKCFVSPAEAPTDDPNSQDGTSLNHQSCITPQKVQLSSKVEMETDDHPGDDSIVKSSVPPSLHTPRLKTRKVKKSTKKSCTVLEDAEVIFQGGEALNVPNETPARDVTHRNDGIATLLGVKSPKSPNSPKSSIKAVESNSTMTVNCETTAAQQLIEKENSISYSIYSKDTEPMELEMELSTSCSAENTIQQPDETPSSDIPIQGNEKDLPPNSPNNYSLTSTVETPRYAECDDFALFVDKHSSVYPTGLCPTTDNRPQEIEKCFPLNSHILKHSPNAFEDRTPRCFTVTENSSQYLEVPDKLSASASVISSDLSHPQHDVVPSKDILSQETDDPVSSSLNDTSDSTSRKSKHSHLVFEDEVLDCFSFAAKCSSKYFQDCGKMYNTTPLAESQPPHPIESSYPIPPKKNVDDLPLNPPCDGASDYTSDTPKCSHSVFKNEDRLSFAGKISFNCNENRNKLIDVATISPTESLLQPKVSAIITPPSSTSRKAQAEVQPASANLNEHSWHSTHQSLTNVFSKIYFSGRPKSLLRLAFDVMLLPMNNDDVFHGLSAISPVTASAEKSVQVDLFLDQTTVKVELGKDPVKRNSFTRRQLSFVPEDSSPPKKSEPSDGLLEPEESEEIVEGTPTKAQSVRVNLLNDSTCTPLNQTLAHDDSPAQICLQSIVNEAPAFSIFDPPPISVEASREKQAHNQSQSSSVIPPSQQTSNLVSPAVGCALKDAMATPQIENFDRFKPPSSTPISSQPMDTSLAYTDSESIIGDSEQPSHKQKHNLALPLGGNSNKVIPKEGIKDQMSSPHPFRNISNIFQITTTGIYNNVEKNAIRKLCGIIKATFSTQLTKDTTHLILPDSEDVMVTTKFLMALYNGSYILPMRWVFDCLISKSILPEADYFFKHPGIHRRMMMPRRAVLFMNHAFYISPEVRQDAVNYTALKDLMKFCNCNITETVEEICRVASTYKCTAVVLRGADYNPSPSNKGPSGVIQVNYQWFYSCLTSYEIQPFFDKHNYD